MRPHRALFTVGLVAAMLLSAAPASADQFIQQGDALSGGGEVGSGWFGTSVAMSGDGNTALVGGPNDDVLGSGAAWVLTRSDGVWTQQGSKLTGSGGFASVGFGRSVALSADGNTALIGHWRSGVVGGVARVFTRSDGVWTFQADIAEPAHPGIAGGFSFSVALSGDGDTALIGDTGVGQGAAWVFTRSNGVWTKQSPELQPSEAVYPFFGSDVELSANGDTAMIAGLGQAWVFTRSAGVWTQQGPKLLGSGASGVGLNIASSLALSDDGNTALMGWPGENTGVGAAWVFTRSNGVWTQQGSKLTGSGEQG